jgi:hypothetical protein
MRNGLKRKFQSFFYKSLEMLQNPSEETPTPTDFKLPKEHHIRFLTTMGEMLPSFALVSERTSKLARKHSRGKVGRFNHF